MKRVWGKNPGVGVLDYVSAWYRKAAEYIQGTEIKVGFVSTNSVTQGEQPFAMFTELFEKWKIKIHFGHRTFPWESEARGKAHVHVVIIGFGAFDATDKAITDYHKGKDPTVTLVSNISPYLIEGPDLAVCPRRKPLCAGIPELAFGNMPNDDGNLLLADVEKKTLERDEPDIAPFIRRIVGPDEYLYDLPRWCLWLVGAPPSVLRKCPQVLERIDKVRQARLKSTRLETNELAKTPSLFGEIRQPAQRYLAIPKTSSEERLYIPMGFLEPDVIVTTDVFTCPAAEAYHFGVLTSAMHMAWVRHVCGRMKSDYRYSAGLVYNPFPWPTPSEKQRDAIAAKASEVLKIRGNYSATNLADLYDRRSMPADLSAAHAKLDREVEKAYRKEKFESDHKRFEFLFAKYQALMEPLLGEERKKSARRAARAKIVDAS